MKKLLQILLRWEARLILKKYKPLIVAVTGSVGKTSAKEAIYEALRKTYKTYRSFGNYNTEVGVPLSIAGTYDREIRGFWQYFLALSKGKLRILFRDKKYPQVLVLEYGADRPGDIRYLVKHFPPNIAVATAIGEIPAHLEYYKNRNELIAEKTALVKKLTPREVAVLNIDDPDVSEMAEKTEGRIIAYGTDEKADIKASGISVKSGASLDDFGLQFKLEAQGKVIPVFVSGLIASHFVYSLLAAVAVGLELKVGILEIVNALSEFQTPPGRMRLLEGIKKTVLIDDSYNSSPIAAIKALGILKELKGARKIAVLGDMLELGEKTEDAHREIGLETGKFGLDFLVTAGMRAKFIADEAKLYGVPEDKVLSFETSDDARLPVQNLLKQGDVVLVKGSRGMRMEKIVREIMAEPERADELLVH